MSRAPSRLNSIRKKQIRKVEPSIQRTRSRIKQSAQKNKRLADSSDRNRVKIWRQLVPIQLLKKYFKYLPIFLLAVITGYFLWLFVKHVDPDAVKHFILPNSYLPFLIIIFIFCFLLCSFLLLNSRQGLLISLAIISLLFLRLQQVMINPWLVIIIILPLITLEMVLSLIKKKNINSTRV
jgi:hypothetical protein